ncbi:MAG: cell division protein FtsK [Alphaproteobacteria bacterium]|nr:cell division protein FtsK [Alphaproteobacteria bacterium]
MFLSRLIQAIPPSFTEFCACRCREAVGAFWLLAGFYVALSFATHNAADASLNVAAVGSAALETKNWGGHFGAGLSDAMFQLIGASAWLLPLVFIGWGCCVLAQARANFILRGLVAGAAIIAVTLLAGTGAFGALFSAKSGTLFNSFWPAAWPAAIKTGLYIAAWVMAGATYFWATTIQPLYFTGLSHWVQSSWYYLMSLRPQNEFLGDEEEDEEEETEEEEIVDEDEDFLEEKRARKKPKKKVKAKVVPKSPKSASEKQKSLNLKDAGSWETPPVDLLLEVPEEAVSAQLDEDALQKNAEMLQSVLQDFNVQGDITNIRPGPVVTLYELEPAPGTKSSRVIGLADDIARSMAASSVRVAVVPGRNVIGIELPNKKRQTVFLRELLENRSYENTDFKLPLILGKDIGGDPIMADLARMPHLLVAGTTGSGKSVAVNTMILSLLMKLSPQQCRFIMIDPKMLELSVYDDIPHLLSPVVTEPGRAVVALKWAVQEMENRYRSMSKLGVRNIEGYNIRLREAKKNGETLMRKVQTGFDPDSGQPIYEEQPFDLTELPYIVVIVDEFADLMLVAGKDVEGAIQRLAQMARAAGIHLIMATQRPSVDVITGVIKANFPTRVSFQVTSKIDSRTILGEGGAEQLLGMGDMLYMAAGGRITRVHGPFVSDNEVENVVNWLRTKGEPDYLDDVTSGSLGESDSFDPFGGGNDNSKVDEFYDKAVALIAREGKASTSFIQRYFQIGYNRAARIIEEMEKQGVVGPANHVGKREVLVGDHSGATKSGRY